MIRVVCRNVARKVQTVAELLDTDADVVLLREAGQGILEELAHAGGDVALNAQHLWEPWPREHSGFWPVVVKLSHRVKVEWLRQVLPSTPQKADA